MSMLSTLALSLALFCSPRANAAAPANPAAHPSPAAVWSEDKLADAQAQFVRVASSSKLEDKQAALDVLVGLGDGRAMGVLVAEFSRVAQDLQASRGAARDAQYAFDRRTIMLANLRELVGRDPSRESLIPREEERRQKAREERDNAVRRRDQLEPWLDALSVGMGKLVAGLGPAARRKAEEQAYQDLDEHPDAGVRAAAIDLIGRLGGAGATLRILDVIERSHVERGKLESRLSKGAADVRKMERRLQEEAAANEGRTARASNDQYDQIKRESAQVRSALTALDAMIEVAVRAGGSALSLETGKDLEKALSKLFTAVAKSKAGARLSVLRVLAFSPGAEVRARVRALVETEKDPAAIAVLLDGVAVLGDKSVEPLVIARCLAHENWLVRSSAAATLARLRSKDAIEPLIERLEKEEGRTRSDIGQALTSLTGQDFHGNVTLWRKWWKDNGASFVVVDNPEQKSFVEEAQEQRGVTFFGISTDSQRVLFVLDLSGSMKFSMTPKSNPDDEPGREPDLPGKGETSRLDAAKRDLIKAIGGLRDGAQFNLVLFASDVWTWADDLVVMAPDKRSQLTGFIESSDAVGGTNIYGALERALDLAGAVGGDTFVDPAIDTIYLLTDGKASVGTTTDREEILSFVRARNQSAHITLHTIGLSDAHDAVLLRRLAEENNGRYVGR